MFALPKASRDPSIKPNNGNVMSTDNTIKYDPVKSVLKHRTGDEIALKEADFARLSVAVLAEIEARYL
jgi:hypothetical protein